VSVLLIGQDDVPRLLPMEECIDAVGRALVHLAKGQAEMPLRTIVWLPENAGALVSMPVTLAAEGIMGIKVLSVIPGNLGTEFDSHQGAVLLFETGNGRLLAIVDATSVTAIRTAAVSAVATKMLARQDAGDLAILGSGTQARTHLEAMMLVRPIRRVRVWSRSPAHASAFADRAGPGMAIETSATAHEAVEDADLVCTTTSSPEPVLSGEWLSPGAHVNAVGAVGPSNRELDSQAIARARVFVDRRESAEHEAGEIVLAQSEGAIGPDHIAGEVGELLIGEVEGRRSPEEITVFRGLGLAVEDLVAVHHVYRRAIETGVGQQVELGGRRE
jgi:alanine dehydrogenase